MQGFFRWFGLVVLGVVVVAVSLYTASRLIPIPAEDAAALALIEAPRATTGRNGFAALWSLNHDVPMTEAKRLLAEDVLRFQASPVWTLEDGTPSRRSVLDARPLLDAGAYGDMLCRVGETGCLQHVRARWDALTPIMASRTAIEARIAALDDYDYFRNPFPARPDMPLPPLQPLLQAQTAHAHAFVRGDHEAGLLGVCRNASVARKLVASGDNLIGGAVGIALMNASAQLFVDMLAELPADRPLPDICEDAFRPDGAMAAGICPTMTGEGKFALGNFLSLNATGQPWYRKLKMGLFLDQRRTMAMGARRHAWFCSPQAEARVRADMSLGDQAPLYGDWTFSCVANAAGCVLDHVAAPSLAGYAERFQDTEARLRVVAAWRALRGRHDDARSLEQRLDDWQRLHAAGRKIRVSADGDGLEIDLFDDRQGRVFALLLPDGRTEVKAR